MNSFKPAILSALVCSALAAVATAQLNSPLDLSGHVLWLEGDDFNGDGAMDTGVSGTPISSWVDKSSGLGTNTVTTTAGAPTMEFGVQNGHNAVLFGNDLQDKMDTLSPFLVSGDYAVFTIIQPDAVAGGSHVLSGLNAAGTDPVLYRNGGSFRFYSGPVGNTDLEIAANPSSTFKLFGYQINSAGTDTGIFQGSQVPREWGAAPLDGLRVGNLDRGTPSSTDRNEAFQGHIAEVIIFNRVLSPAETNSLTLYANSKYNLGLTFPTGLMTQIETGNVSGGAPSTLLPTSEPVVSGRINGALSSNGGLAFAQDFIAAPRDFRPARTNDGVYSDLPEGPAPVQEPWIAGTANSFVGIKLGAATTIDRIGFEDQFGSRRNGSLIFEFTDDDLTAVPTNADLGLDPAAVNALDWDLLDVIQIADDADTRHLYSFNPIANVTGVRVRIESTAVEFAMSELEVWAVPEPVRGYWPLPVRYSLVGAADARLNSPRRTGE